MVSCKNFTEKFVEDINYYYNETNYNRFPLHYYITHRSEERTLLKIESLLKMVKNGKAKFNRFKRRDSRAYMTPLMLAVMLNQIKVASKLLECLYYSGDLAKNLNKRGAFGLKAIDFVTCEKMVAIFDKYHSQHKYYSQQWIINHLPQAYDNEALQVHMMMRNCSSHY